MDNPFLASRGGIIYCFNAIAFALNINTALAGL